MMVTLDAEFTEMIQDNLNFVRTLFPDYRGLEIALIDADNEWHADVTGKDTFWEGDVELFGGFGGLAEIFSIGVREWVLYFAVLVEFGLFVGLVVLGSYPINPYTILLAAISSKSTILSPALFCS